MIIRKYEHNITLNIVDETGAEKYYGEKVKFIGEIDREYYSKKPCSQVKIVAQEAYSGTSYEIYVPIKKINYGDYSRYFYEGEVQFRNKNINPDSQNFELRITEINNGVENRTLIAQIKVAPINTPIVLSKTGKSKLPSIETKGLNVTETPIVNLPARESNRSESPNVYIGATGIFHRAVKNSSKKIKHDIKPLSDKEIAAENLYDVKIYQAKYNKDILSKDDDRYLKNLPMFIIEQLNEHYPVCVDKPEADSKSWSWNSQYLIPGMLDLIQKQHKDIIDLKSKIEEIERRIK